MKIDERDRERFFANVDRNGPEPAHRHELGACHLWKAGRTGRGYGAFQIRRKKHLAHRLAFFIAHGRWPDPCCLHRCDNPACVNPEHLFEGSQPDNIADMVSKGREASRERNGRAKLSESDVQYVRKNYNRRRMSQRKLADLFGVSQQTISRVLSGQLWTPVHASGFQPPESASKVHP